MLRGQALAGYVAAQMRTTQTTEQIARSLGYSVHRCAGLIARSGHGPLARQMLARHESDQTAAIVPPKPVRLIADGDIVDALVWLGSQEMPWDAAAHRIGWDPDALRSWTIRRGLQWRMAAWYPARFAPRAQVEVNELVEDLLEMADCGRSWITAAEQCGYRDHRSLERRLLRHGRMDEVRAAFERKAAA